MHQTSARKRRFVNAHVAPLTILCSLGVLAGAPGLAAATQQAKPAETSEHEAPSFSFDDPTEARVVVTVLDPVSPFARTVWEWKTRGRSPLVGFERVTVDDFGRQTGLALVPVADFAVLLREVEQACTVSSAVTPEPPLTVGDTRVVHVRMSSADTSASALWSGGHPAGERCLDVVRAAITARTEVSRWRAPFWVDGEFGMLRTDTDVPTWVTIDGVSIGETTPLVDYRLEPGQHAIRWDTLHGDGWREETVTIEAGRTTTLDVVIEMSVDPAGGAEQPLE